MTQISPAKVREFAAAQSDAWRAQAIDELARELRTAERRAAALADAAETALSELRRTLTSGGDYAAEMAGEAVVTAAKIPALVATQQALLAELGRMGVDVSLLRG